MACPAAAAVTARRGKTARVRRGILPDIEGGLRPIRAAAVKVGEVPLGGKPRPEREPAESAGGATDARGRPSRLTRTVLTGPRHRTCATPSSDVP